MKSPSLLAFSLSAFLLSAHQAAQADTGGAIDFAIAANTPSSASSSASTLDSPPSAPASTSPALSFVPPAAPASSTNAPADRTTADPASPTPVVHRDVPAPWVSAAPSDIFTGGSDSLVARTVGHAEGTRASDGSKNRAYYGHSDPGNGVWNLGSFSYQHGAKSPEEADEKQLRRLEQQAEVIRQKADSHRLSLSLEEELNGIDLANQSPLAALDTPGYVERLKQAHDRGLTGAEAVLWARTQSYWDPQLNRWNAPGLGNTEGNISHDQNRRLTAIARALDVYQQQALTRRREDEPQDNVAGKPQAEKVADSIIFQDLSQPRTGEVAQAKP